MCGAIAGGVAKTTIAPLDRTKILFQTSRQEFSAKNAIGLLKKMYNEDGVRSWWRGNSAMMARVLPFAAVQFMSHEQFKQLFRQDRSGRPVSSPGLRFLAGSLAGVTATAVTYPLDFLRARMAVGPKHHYKDVFNTAWHIVTQEGWMKLYRGFMPTILGVAPYAGISFFTYESLKKITADQDHGREPTAVERLGFGALAGLFGQSASYPLDVVRRRMQTDTVIGGDIHYRTMKTSTVYIFNTEGIRKGLYKALMMNWVKGPIVVGVSFTVYDFLRKAVAKVWGEY
jgi:solute carrier family 25 protein 42